MISNSTTSVNPIPPAALASIVKSVQEAAKSTSGSVYVAFDADGTLWRRDASEIFFEYLIEKALVPLPADPINYYQNLKAIDPKVAYTWLAQILQGRSVEQVKSWATAAYVETPLEVFGDIFDLIQSFHAQGIEIWVVTASVQWAVEAAAAHYGFPTAGVLGVTTKIENGKITDKGVLPVTWREGKAEALLSQHPGGPPLFCAGNTTGDLFLMELSKTPPLALHSHKEPSSLKTEELSLQNLAVERGWLTHSF